MGAPGYAEPLGKLTQVASRAGHFALYGLAIAMPVSGYLGSTAGGTRFHGSGLFELPRLVAKDRVTHRGGRLEPGVRLDARVRAGRASRRGRLACNDKTRFRADANVAEISAGAEPRRTMIRA